MNPVKTLKRGWSQENIRSIRIQPSAMQEKAKADSLAMKRGAELLEASRIAIRGLLSDTKTFGDVEAAKKLLAILEG